MPSCCPRILLILAVGILIELLVFAPDREAPAAQPRPARRQHPLTRTLTPTRLRSCPINTIYLAGSDPALVSNRLHLRRSAADDEPHHRTGVPHQLHGRAGARPSQGAPPRPRVPASPTGSIMTDRVEFTAPFGILGGLVKSCSSADTWSASSGSEAGSWQFLSPRFPGTAAGQ